MSRLEDVKQRVVDQMMAASDLTEVERGISIWRSTAEAEKHELEINKLKLETASIAARSESIRFWVPVLAPLVSAIILAFTLWLQVAQFNENARIQNENSRLQREANEDAQFRETIKTIQNPFILHGISGVPLLKSFLVSPRYQRQAREIAVGFLPGIQKLDLFKSLFEAVMAGTDWNNFNDIVRINVELEKEYKFLDDKLEYLKKHPGVALRIPGMPPSLAPEVPPGGPPGMTQEGRTVNASELKEILDGVVEREHLTAVALAQFLKKPRPPGVKVDKIDLSGLYLWDVDLSGADLKNAVLTDTTFERSNLEDADLSNVFRFGGSRWPNTAWWRAKKISPQLLVYLDTHYKFKSGRYYFDDQTKSDQEYQAEIRRLRASK